MAKSKLVKVNEKIVKGVVHGYKKIEEGAVGGFNKIADKFVDNFLTKEGEFVEETKVRLAEEQKKEKQQKGRQVRNHEKEYVCSNDFRNNWRRFICAWHLTMDAA